MENFATGLRHIFDLCKKGHVKADFLKDEYIFTVHFYRHCEAGWKKYTDKNMPKKEPLREPLKGLSKSQRLNSIALKKLVENNPKITRKELAIALGISFKARKSFSRT